MYDKEKQNVTLNIAGEQVKTVINRSEEEELRKIEKQVTGLWKQWKQMNPSKTDSQVLAMVAFQYAKLYYDELLAGEKREAALQSFIKTYEERLNKIVIDV
ncbi:MAG TPA: cell division protein ZapA [Candidatus Limisoma intestinavium]|uniref:Cell division protein ZapA n=1 Tax=Candidatus Limisoma intestinavium TaxID=2840856 RepID=A0A9D1LGT8_9BACT|nr:cell division protein ZapA [Candidatus Limisoma intestinavium]